jgi:hypothetical protein
VTSQPVPNPVTPPTHTDQCIRDAAQFGFCAHTRLYAAPTRTRPIRPLPSYLLPPSRLTRAGWRRETTAWVGVLLVFGPALWLLLTHGWLPFLAVYATGLGWILLFTCGLPQGLTADLSKVLPRDAAHRLRNPPPDSKK